MKNLLLTLGHNSSAILVEDGQIKWGYETERVSGIKSDSRFPSNVIDFKGLNLDSIDMIYATHWAPDGLLNSMGSKYWKPDVFEGIPIRTLSADRSHHDAHIHGALCYAGPKFPLEPRTIGVVIDGFGIFGEHFSIYKFDNGRPTLIRRYRGYDTSLGLWYQYATAFMGLKMHEDEYKLLGYEVHVPDDISYRLDVKALERANFLADRMDKSIYGSAYDPVFSIDALAKVKDLIFKHLSEVCQEFNITDSHTTESRAILAYYVQAVLEKTVMLIVNQYNPSNLLLSGGVFYNVKLNKRLIDSVTGKVCVYPLAGDQGNAVGLYAMDHPEFVFPADLNWGHRELRSPGHVPNLVVVSEVEALHRVTDLLDKQGVVNLVRGSMEFGPRAMCNTSTLAIPTMANVHRINHANERNTVMPMAPVMTSSMYRELFENPDRVWRSQAHMIVAMEYKEYPIESMLGAAHEYQRPYHHHTGRPQVVSDSDTFMQIVLKHVGQPLINTSFNYHGYPIALGMESIIANHMMQHQKDKSFHTVVIQNA